MDTKLTTVLFDLDGTLLPMDQDHFMQVYFGALAEKCAAFGFEKEPLIKAVWKGTKAMVMNDGGRTNEDVFWAVFSEEMGEEILALKPELEKFYEEEFNKARIATGKNPLAEGLLQRLKDKGIAIVLATNPLFPMRAVHTRLAWLGLSPELFSHITSYETSHYCKPNLEYYREILKNISKTPEECLMVGNDVAEDACAAQLGMDFFLVTDSILNPEGTDISEYANGDFAACCQYVEGIFG